MSNPSPQSIEELFLSIVELSPRQQHEVLEAMRAEKPHLVAQIQGLLAADQSNDDGLLEQPATTLSELTPVRVGRYTITRRIGEGGMGTVYEANCSHPSGTFAIKIIRAGLATDRVLRRFESESGALSLLDHPGIVKICEAGVCQTEYPDGSRAERPFLAMELIDGPDLLAYAQQARLDERARLALFAGVCDAVHHAHQRGVIHRDLKPANILVHSDGQPKVLDFGVAALANPGRHVTTLTRTGQLIGTPAYMSPEQSRPGIRVPDVRSDVFSLGVILHELLTGVLPPSIARLNSDGRAEDRVAPNLPPQAHAAITPSRDVQTIMAKAVDPDPGHRYQSAALLADDLRRFIDGEPIEARPASTIERAVRFARGNRTVVGAVAAAFVALLVGGSVAVYQAIEALRLARLEAAARVNAVAARDEANATLAFLTNMLSAADTDSYGRNVTVRELLDHVAGKVEEEWKDKPLVAAAIEDALGRTYVSLGEFSIARDHLEVAYAIRSKRLSADDPLLADSSSSLGTVLTTLGEHDRAATLLTRAVEIRSRVLGPSHPLTFAAMGGLASSLVGLQKFDEAERLYQQIVAGAPIENADEASLRNRSAYAVLLTRLGKTEAADAIYKQVLPRQELLLGPDSMSVMLTRRGAAGVARALGHMDEAERLMRSIVDRQDRVLGPDHPESLGNLHDLSILYLNIGRPDAAKEMLARVVAGAERSLGPEHRNTLKARFLTAQAIAMKGDTPSARTLAAQVLAQQRASLGERTIDVADSLQLLGAIEMSAERYEEAQRRFAESIAIFTSILPEHDQTVAAVRSRHGESLLKLGRHEEALAELTAGFMDLERASGPCTRCARVAAQIAECLERLGRVEEARHWRARSEEPAARTPSST